MIPIEDHAGGLVRDEGLMRLLIFTSDVPEPPIHGGRLDARNLLQALARCGHESHLVSWTRDRPTASATSALLQYCSSVRFVKRRSMAGSLARNPLLPAQVSSRLGGGYLPDRAVDGIVCVGLYALGAAFRAAAPLGLPIVLRSQNVESRYFSQLADTAKGWRRAYYLYDQQRFAAYERRVLKNPSLVAVADISHDDSLHHAALSPQAEAIVVPAFAGVDSAQIQLDHKEGILFFGHLSLPNSLNGLLWFVREVLPILRASIPGISFVVAGRTPSVDTTRYLTSQGIVVLPDPLNKGDVYRRASVSINPTFAGSGVNMKVIDSLAHGLPVVTSEFGARGLPVDENVIRRAASPTGFAAHIEALIRFPPPLQAVQKYLTENFDDTRGASLLVDRLRLPGSAGQSIR